MWVRWVHASKLDYPRAWKGTMARMLKLIEEEDYIDLALIPQLVERINSEDEFDGSDQFVLVEPDDMKVEKEDPYKASSLNEE